MDKNKQTAVEWLFQQMYGEPQGKYSFAVAGCKVDEMFNQAKAMETEQIINAFYDGCFDTNSWKAEQYYKENYGD